MASYDRKGFRLWNVFSQSRIGAFADQSLTTLLQVVSRKHQRCYDLVAEVKAFGITKSLFTLDRGFYSESNTKEMTTEKIDFILPLPDNFSPHIKEEVRSWCEKNDVELVFLPIIVLVESDRMSLYSI